MFGTKYNYLVWLIYQLFLYLSFFLSENYHFLIYPNIETYMCPYEFLFCFICGAFFTSFYKLFYSFFSTMLSLHAIAIRNNTKLFWICPGKYCLRSKYRPNLQGRCNDRGQYCQYKFKKPFGICCQSVEGKEKVKLFCNGWT